MSNNILIIGSGAFGTALSQPLIDNNHNVYFYSKNLEINNNLINGEHPIFSNIKFKPPKGVYTNLTDAFKSHNYDYILICIPSKNLIELYKDLKPFLNPNIIVINTSKGLNPETNGIWSSLFLKDDLINGYALIVGPSFASDLILKNKTIINVISSNPRIAFLVEKLFNNNYFKLVYFEDEYVASLCSSFKNSLAIALGIINSLSNSVNTHSAFLTIGLSEIQIIISKLTKSSDIKILDFFGVGDIFLTCSSDMSRNYHFGSLIANYGLEDAINKMNGQTVEGYRTLKFIKKFIDEYKLESPLFNTLYKVCYENYKIDEFMDTIWKSINY